VFECHRVAPECQCTNHRRRARQSLSARAVFLLDARYVCGRESITGGRVRVVGRHVGREPCVLVCAPRSRSDDLAVAVG